MTDFILISILNTRFICCCSCAIKIHKFSSEMNTRTIQMENGITWTKWMKRRSGINRLSQKMMKILFNHHLFTVWNHWLSHIRWARGLLVQSHLLYLSKWINKFSPQLIYTAVMPFRRGDNLESGRLICGPEMVVVDSKTVPKTIWKLMSFTAEIMPRPQSDRSWNDWKFCRFSLFVHPSLAARASS